jgi:ribosomal-protein-alanine N-acetyltransferase
MKAANDCGEMSLYAEHMTLKHNKTIFYANSRIILRRLSPADREEYVKHVTESADHLFPWVRLPGTLEAFDEYIMRFDGEIAECTVLCDRDSGEIAGVVDITQITRGAYQRAVVGYYSFIPWAGNGYMSEGFPLVLRFAFEDLGLHRLEADIQPRNSASLRFAEKVGFRREGYSPSFVYIDGEWRDHERWAITADAIKSRAILAQGGLHG